VQFELVVLVSRLLHLDEGYCLVSLHPIPQGILFPLGIDVQLPVVVGNHDNADVGGVLGDLLS